ncbi:MAG: 3-oxoacyl-[acyl-carrier protein] reductase [Candidatus Azotimanducaceae bacterium]|jgi:3-oxoacyl-[acyl-carrier protein] reductase
MNNLAGKVAVVTGASRGIGKAIAESLAANGAFVLGTATSEAGAASISEYLSESGRGFVLRVEDEASIEAFFAAIKSEFDAPTILVNNAGIARDNIALRMKSEEWDDVIVTNLSAVFKVTKACLRGMTKARWGRVINISSVVASMGNAGQSNYAAAKAGLEGYSRSLASELASRNVTVNCIAPGFIATDMTDSLPEEQKELLLSRVPAKRLGEANEVAALVSFLAGDSSGYITGETIHINGGMYMS